MSLWVEIPRWDEFQHYKNRDPIWIRDYVRQLNDPDYLALSFAQRGLLHDLRLLYAMRRRNIRLDTATMSRALNGRVLSNQLQTLNHAGLIRLVASKPLPQRQTDRLRLSLDLEAEDSLPIKKTAEKANLAQRLLSEISDATERTQLALHSFHQRLPDAAFAMALESLRHRRAAPDKPPLQSEARYVVATLTTMERERGRK